MRQVTLGRSGLVVSRLAYGTWQLGGDWGPTDTAAAMDSIRQAVDAGVTLFDTRPPDQIDDVLAGADLNVDNAVFGRIKQSWSTPPWWPVVRTRQCERGRS